MSEKNRIGSIKNNLTFNSLKDIEGNIIKWKAKQHNPGSNLINIVLFGYDIKSDRHLAFNMYLVHIFNKELDDFDKRSIRVLGEFGDRHCVWELKLKKRIKQMSRKNIKSDRKRSRQACRLLLGIPKLNLKPETSETDSDKSSKAKRKNFALSLLRENTKMR